MGIPPPEGTVTFLFTDIEGSTPLWEEHRQSMLHALPRHDAILREIVEAHNGFVFKTAGDAFCVAFARAIDALLAAISIQRRLNEEPWPTDIGSLRVRIGLHSGTAVERDHDYFGPAVNRVARIEAAAHGGQILLSHAAEELVLDELPDGVALVDLGEYRLKGLSGQEQLFQVAAAGLGVDLPPLRTLNPQLTNLPIPETALFGREIELKRITEMLSAQRSRLVTLTGPGGVGKTSLALHAAADLLPHFPDGVYQVLLAPLTEAEVVPAAVAAVLGARETPDKSLVETVRDMLRHKRLLLLLDNFEHLLPATEYLSEWLVTAPGLKVLATSRSPLNLRAEQEFPVAPLPVPQLETDPNSLESEAAVALFLTRARAVHPSLDITAAEANIVAEICRRLDGLPLAIELAAARTRLLPLPDLLKRLESTLPVLAGGPRDAPSRQRSLRETIAWSYRLLTQEEQKLFRQLAVFRGGFSLEGVTAVSNFNSPMETLEHLDPLATQSLIQPGEADGELRFSMLETVREYALEELTAAAELDELHRRHLDYYAELARGQRLAWRSGDYDRVFAQLNAERDNLHAALQWSLDPQQPPEIAEQGAWAAGHSWTYWLFGNSIDEARRWLRRAIDRVSWHSPARAKALVGAGLFAWQVGDYQEAEVSLHEGLALWRTIGDPEELADATHMTGHLEFDRQRYETARDLFSESLELYRSLEQPLEMATLTSDLGLVAMHLEEIDLAESYYRKALQLFHQQGSHKSMSDACYRLGDLARMRGDDAGAKPLFEEGLAQIRPSNYKLGIACGLHKLAQVARKSGDVKLAHDNLHNALLLQREMSNKQGIVESLAALGGLALDTGQVETAAQLLAVAQTLLEELGAPLSPPDRKQLLQDEQAVRQVLDDETFCLLWGQGSKLSWEQAAELALAV